MCWGRLKCIYCHTWLVFCFISVRVRKPRCPSFPLPSLSQLSPSLIALPLFPWSLPGRSPVAPLQQPCRGSASPHHACANWGLMRGICFSLCAYGSPAGALAWLSPFRLSAVPGGEQMLPGSPTENSWMLSLPCHGLACAPCHPAGMLGVRDLDPALQGESQAAAETIIFSLSQKKNNQLHPSCSV